MMRGPSNLARATVVIAAGVLPWILSAQEVARTEIGREIAIARHLQDDEELRIPLAELLEQGRQLFTANWTEQEGAGRPLTKGTGKELTDPGRPLTGRRSFNRLSGPDANSCAGCHNAPYGIAGGGGDIVTNVFVQAQRFDFATLDASDDLPTRGSLDEANVRASLQTVGNSRATTGMFGAGYLEMLARQKPYAAENPMALIYKHKNEPVPTLPEAFAALQPLLDKLLAKKPADRFPNALAAMDAIIAAARTLKTAELAA